MKIQPLEFEDEIPVGVETGNVKVVKSRLKRLFDRQFQRVLKNNSDNNGTEVEPSSVCLAKMVQNFIEESSNDKQHHTSSKGGCNCFKGNSNITADDAENVDISLQSIDLIKTLVQCSSVAERNLLADTSRIFDKNKLHKRKDEEIRHVVAECLVSLGYNASICKSSWDKSASHPAGEYEYIDVILENNERILIDIDFRSEFQIARPTGSYKALLQTLPFIFVGKVDRLQRIITTMSDAARQSLKQKGMPFPPWRKAEYMKCKWLAAHVRQVDEVNVKEVEEVVVVTPPWSPPAVRVKSCGGDKERKGVTGLASLLKEKP